MHPRTLASLLFSAILAAAPPFAAAQSGEDEMNALDGARQCAAAKSALSLRVGQTPASVASTNIDITYYHLSLTPNMAAGSLAGVVRIEGTVVGSSMSTLTLDLSSSMIVNSVKLSDATPLVFVHPGAALQITLPSAVLVGGSIAIDVTYSGTPVSTGFGSFVFGTRAGKRFAWSLSEPYGARDWWPCKDHPSDKADSVRVTVTVPSVYRVGSQGLMTQSTAGGNTTYNWVSHYPISSYLISVAISEYVPYSGTYTRPAGVAAEFGALTMPLYDLVYDDGSSAQPAGWAGVGDIIGVFEDEFGPYPFANEKYGHSECTFGGGMEHQTMGSLGGSTVSLVSHELTHQWFGDSISPKTWPHVWLNEGFATYGELVYWEARQATYPGAYQSVLSSRYLSATFASGTLVLQDTSDVGNMFDFNRVYAKGAVVLNMLRYVVDDDAVFKNILRSYIADPAVQYGVATTADFQRVAETVSGLDLDAFFTEWVTTGQGYPWYQTYNFSQPFGVGYKMWVTVKQTQPVPYYNVFTMPLVIAVETTGGEQRFRVQNDQRQQTFELSLSAQPLSVAIDPDHKIIRDAVIVSSVAGATPRLSIASIMPNPVQRTLMIGYATGTEGRVDIDVFDVAGRRVMSRAAAGPAGGRVETLDASPLAAGVYFVRLRNAEGQATRKFVVVR